MAIMIRIPRIAALQDRRILTAWMLEQQMTVSLTHVVMSREFTKPEQENTPDTP